MNSVTKAWTYLLAILTIAILAMFIFFPEYIFARNINQYKDTISDSTPNIASNHTLSFVLNTDISPGSYIEITPPDNFEISSSSLFSEERNVELLVNGVVRDSGLIQTATEDQVEIFDGIPGMIRYTLNTTTGISSGSNLELKIGNHTSQSNEFSVEYSTSTGTTTTEADIKPIINDSTIGTKEMSVEIYDGSLVAEAGFLIALVDQVGVGPADTTETIPPDRFNGAPTTTVTGVTLNVELFMETNEFAICKLDRMAGTEYYSMPTTFTGTGLIYHTIVVAVTPDTLQSFYVRCMDDEGNYNNDDYLIEFYVSAAPTGSSTTDGTEDGDGTGTGNAGTGDGSAAGGETGGGGGESPTTGGTSGSGGSGGGGGGGSGNKTGSTGGGGFESTDAPYRSGDGRVVITGTAFPGSTVYSLVDGKASVDVKADSKGEYSITIDEIARGAYTFGVYAIDSAKNKSSTFSTSFTVTGARTSALSNINLAPTIKVTPDPVNPGGVLTLSGFALPNSTVTIENEKDKSSVSKKSFTATASANGSWSLNVPTDGFSSGTYKIRAKSEQSPTMTTGFSNYTFYGVGQSAVKPNNTDLNKDGKVNLVDFSILLFWWNTDGGTSNPSADINGDGKVSLTDFSILLFNWTG